MFNPFKKRASEYMQDEASFLLTVTPEPLFTFVEPKVKQGVVYDRLVAVRGTPGSGKTTIAALFRYSTLATLLRNSSVEAYGDLLQALAACGAIRDGNPAVVACRIPMEAEYRDIWELPYPDEVKSKLLFTIIQARAVLLWLRDLEAVGADSSIEVIRAGASDAAAQEAAIETADDMRRRAREVEADVYRITAALVPMPLEELRGVLWISYRPFDVLTQFKIKSLDNAFGVQPMVILDDAHSLHRDQLEALMAWLMRRDLNIARWVMTRLDAVGVDAALYPPREPSDVPGTDRSREITEIWLQQPLHRTTRRNFRSMARDMSDRYLRQMPVFNRRNWTSLAAMLETVPVRLTEQKVRELVTENSTLAQKLGIAPSMYERILADVAAYAKGSESEDVGADVQCQMTRILMHRIAVRRQRGLFDLGEDESEKLPQAASDVAHGARLQLYHEHGRPFYFGIDTISDAAGENAEQFLRLASGLVDLLEQRLISNKKLEPLDAARQDKTLRETAIRMIDEWNFPESTLVRRLVDALAARCLKESRTDNAWLGAGAGAIGIPDDEYRKLPVSHPRLASVLRYAYAYNVCSARPTEKPVKGRMWYKIELGGPVRLKHGLTLLKGNFAESTALSLARVLEGGTEL